MLDSMDGGAAENILYEGGPKYTEAIDAGSSELHPIDQIIILSLCLDVHNSNPMVSLSDSLSNPANDLVMMIPS